MTKEEYDRLQDKLTWKLEQKKKDCFYSGKRLEGYEEAILAVKSMLHNERKKRIINDNT